MAAKLGAAVAGAGVGAMLGRRRPAGSACCWRSRDRSPASSPPTAGSSCAHGGALRGLRELPALLDLLRVTVEAGLPLAAALAEVGRRARGPLAEEWRRVGRETALGVPLAAALAGVPERVPLAEVESLVAALDRAARHGAPLAATLSAQADGARLARRRRIGEEAARAGPKIQLVVALLLVPSVLLLVAAALVAALLDGGAPAGLGP